MKIEVSIGEIVDKLSILQIKKNNITDLAKLENVKKEYLYLHEIVFAELNIQYEDFQQLVFINDKLWTIEDSIRDKERLREFDDEFIFLARNVYKINDERAQVKKNINIKYGSKFVEEKSYAQYQ
jgi:hypothetical protein